jgi:hypothetical protein
MAKRTGWLVSVISAFILTSFFMASAKPEFFKVGNLQPGMRGIGKTCFQGTKPEEFQVEILGVLQGVNPGASAVLAKFSGSRLDKTGIFEGMSGSPVYIDGKLLGAVAFSYSFAKEAIGGITPITQMVDSFDEASSSSSSIKNNLKKSRLWNYRLPLPAMRTGSAEFPGDMSNEAPKPLQAESNGHALIPIATPLSMSGFQADALKTFSPQLRAMGMSILQGAGGSKPAAVSKESGEADSAPLEPGSNIVVPLVRGDLEVSAGGTVTYVDGNRLYAFGHNLFQLGFTELPMHKAKAIMVFPSLESSFKILELGDLAGTIRQDRGAGIYGIVGEKPRMVPMQISLTTSRGAKKEFKFELARDNYLTPLLVNLIVYNTIVSSERAQGMVTLSVKGKIHIKGEQTVEVDNRFSSDSEAPSSASLSIAVPVNYLMAPGYSNLDLQHIELEISVRESDQAAVLDSIRATRSEVKAGESLEMEVSSKQINGATIRDTYTITVPENASPGALMVMVADGSTLMKVNEEEDVENVIPRDLAQLVKLINNLRKNDRLYVRFFRQEPGAIVKGEGLPGLPPSILAILRSDRKAGAINQIHTSTLMEYELPATDYMVAGAKILKLMVKP